MNSDNSINLVEFFGKVLSYYKLYIPLIITVIILGYVMTDKNPSYKVSVLMTDIFSIVKPNDIKRNYIFKTTDRARDISFNQFPNGVMKITHTSKDIDAKKYLESLVSKFESSYISSESRQNKIISDYIEKVEIMLYLDLLELTTIEHIYSGINIKTKNCLLTSGFLLRL